MLHLLFVAVSQVIAAHPISSTVIVGFAGYARKVVKAVFDFVIYFFEQAARLKKAYREMREVDWKAKERVPEVHGVASHTHACGCAVQC